MKVTIMFNNIQKMEKKYSRESMENILISNITTGIQERNPDLVRKLSIEFTKLSLRNINK